jgi:hypothetical protein
MIAFNFISSVTFWLGTILPLGIMLIALLLFILGFLDFIKTRRLRKWPTASGIIIKSEISRRHDGYFQTVMRYRFQAQGQIFESDKFFHDQKVMSYGSGTAQEKIAPYPVGKVIEVYYQPQNPAHSLVEIKSTVKFYVIGAFALIGFGLIFAANFWAIELFAKP